MSASAGARRLAGDRNVRSAEVALVGETDVKRNIRQRVVRFPQKLGRSGDPLPYDVTVRRKTGALLERPVEVPRGECGNAGESFGREVFGQVPVDVLANAAQSAGRESAERWAANRACEWLPCLPR